MLSLNLIFGLLFCLIHYEITSAQYEGNSEKPFVGYLKNIVQNLEQDYDGNMADDQMPEAYEELGKSNNLIDVDDDDVTGFYNSNGDESADEDDISKRYYMRMRTHYCLPISPCIASRGRHRWASCICRGKSKCRRFGGSSRCF